MPDSATYPQVMAAEPFQARDVAAAFRRRLPGVGAKKLHKLLYYAQGHHLATFGRPLFVQSISAWDTGPVIGALWHEEKAPTAAPDAAPLDQASLNTVGYVVSRYGRLTGRDLEVLSHGEPPWQEADQRRKAAHDPTARLSPDVIRAYFAADADEDDPELDRTELEALFAGVEQRTVEAPQKSDDLDRLRRLRDQQQTA